MTHLGALPSLDPAVARALVEAGVDTLEAVVELGPTRLADRARLDVRMCRAVVRGAKAALRKAPEPPSAGPALAGARALEAAQAVVRKAEATLGPLPAREKWAEAHARARRQLRKLLRDLERLQREVLSDGATDAGHAHLVDLLEGLERSLAQALTEPTPDRGPDKPTLNQVRRAAKAARRALASRAGR